ncbi:MAG: HIT family protein [Patescibacteria group bacterium]
MKDCVFCKIVAGDVPCYEIWQDGDHLAFLTLWPNTEGFSVVIPKEHHPSNFAEANEQVTTKLVAAARQVAQKISSVYKEVERCAMVFEGYGVDHLHAKLIPLHATAGSEWRQFNHHDDKFFTEYEGYISTHEPADMADADWLKKTAEKIREA